MEERTTTHAEYEDVKGSSDHVTGSEANRSGVSWSAVFAGAFASAALGLILLSLGTGLGLSAVSMWSNTGASAATLGKAAILWLILMEVLSSAMGGHIAGRLRTKWTTIHSDEVYFRDTAHGFLAWSVALVLTAAFLTSAAASLVGTPSSETSKGSQSVSHSSDPDAYFVDSLFRTEGVKSEATATPVTTEAAVIFTRALAQGELPALDENYLSQLVATRTGLSESDANKRVSDVFSNAKQAAETTRKALAHSLLWTFAALLIGAFCASFAATIGGRQRDHVVLL